ncbi:MAG: hypothetical protein IJO71_12640 [Microbacterium sp.]|uniref:hypothetical protein n=1 Tax=Microbacterium sp. TaxID=51671 RepID=UPI0025EB9C79|nr:hypothetical protein [Microbacterium sp.]MBQ9918031.1 hypothetical protein [Microbacterium sp.]
MTAVVDAVTSVPSPFERRLLAEIREHVDRMTVSTRAVLDVVASRAERRVAPTLPPLLSELRGAIRPSGSGRTSGAATSAPLPFDATALELLTVIEAGIAEMYRSATDVEPLGTSEQLLLEWFREFEFAFRAGDLVEAQLRNYRDRVRSYRFRIEDFFMPPKQFEMPLCPRCGYTHEVVLVDGELIKRRCAVLTSWGDASRREPVAECRHCGARWSGFDELRGMQREIDENVEHYGVIDEVTYDPAEDDALDDDEGTPAEVSP